MTEHSPVDDYHALRSAIGRLTPKVRLAIDDAGGGSSEDLGADVFLDNGLTTIDRPPRRRRAAARFYRAVIVCTAERTSAGLPGHRAVEWLRALGESFQAADVLKEQADLMHVIYEGIRVAGPQIVGVRLTAAADAHGSALALPRLLWRARQVSDTR